VEQLIKFQEESHLKIVPKLTMDILYPKHYEKMSVSNALILMSKATSAGLRFLVRCHNFSEDLLTTAYFIDLNADWFALINSRSKKTALSHRKPQKYNSYLSSFTKNNALLFK
jgi:hypothetical protein